jgi:hypothetical protein
MNKIIIIKFLTILVFITGCGYTPIFSSKNTNFSIVEVKTTGDNKLNKILNNKLNIYKNSKSEKKYYLNINTSVEKKISSKDSKGNPKTFELKVITKTNIQDEKNNNKEKIFIKTVNYNNNENKLNLKKYENQSKEVLVEKISEEMIIYLQTN